LFLLGGIGQGQPVEKSPLRWAADAEGGAPYIFKDPNSPAVNIGFEVDLAAELEKELGRRIEWTQYDFRNLVPGLQRRDFDFAMNGLEITADRKDKILFSRPYYLYKLQLVVRADEARFRSLDQCRAVRGVVGTLEDTAAERLLDKQNVAKKVYDSQVEPYVDLELGRTDAVLLDLPIAVYYAQPNPKLKFVGEPLASGSYAIAFRKDQVALAREFDAALARLAQRGALRRIYEKWRIWNDDQAALFDRSETHDVQHEFRARRGSPDPAGSPTEGLPDPSETSGRSGDAVGRPHPSAVGRPHPSAGPHPSAAADAPLESRRRWSWADCFWLLLQGAWVTIQVSVLGMLLAIALGLPIAICRLYGPRPVRFAAAVYVEFFRGIPVLLLLYFLYYGLPVISQNYGLEDALKLSAFTAAVLGFGLNYAAYEAEIYRAGIGSIPLGQWEAAASLGMSPWLTFRRIILPQAIRIILPPMTNDFIALFKDTSLVSVIAVVELTKQYQILAKSSMRYLEIGLATAALYLVMSVPLGYLSRHLEKRWGKGQ
jgi:polar amino acid transport system substrate-binding protein